MASHKGNYTENVRNSAKKRRGPYNAWFSQITGPTTRTGTDGDDGRYHSGVKSSRRPYNAGFSEPSAGRVKNMPKTTNWRWQDNGNERKQGLPNKTDMTEEDINGLESANCSLSLINNNDVGDDDYESDSESDSATACSAEPEDLDFVLLNQHDRVQIIDVDDQDDEYDYIMPEMPEAEPTTKEFGDDEHIEDDNDDYGYHDSNNDSNHDHHDDDDKPIYNGARVSVGVHMLLIMTFVVRHSLSSAAIVDLLTLIDLHCLANNLCRTSFRMFHKYFDNWKTPVERHYYCTNTACAKYFGKNPVTNCVVCQKQQQTPAYFFISPLSGALQTVFNREGILSHLQYPQKRVKQHEFNIEDVYDGKIYRERFDKDGYFKGTPQQNKTKEIHISLQLNTDGVALFKSSKYSVWPVFLVINELHPKLRYSRQYRILAGMWFGQNKPMFETFMQPVADMLNNLYTEGVNVTLPDGKELTVKALVLNAVFDSPARCLFQKFTQFNGKHGCPFCTSQGESVKTSENGTTQTYQFNINSPQTGHGPERTHEETIQHAAEAESLTKPGNVMGVKGRSAFLNVATFDIIRCVVPDYMHGIMLGIIKMLLGLWFDPSHRMAKWSVRKHVKEVDARLTSIKPPSMITRPPQAIETHIKWWKASEYRSFLLFYSIPCMYGILPEQYFQHMLLLVNSMHILLSNSISSRGLRQARQMLLTFVFQIRDLYHPRYLTWNVHSVLHYVEKVKDHGPLYILSCFWFEDFNGDLRNMFHGTRGVELQVLTAVAISQKIPLLANRLKYGTLASELYDHMTKKAKSCKIKIVEKISETTDIVGVLTNVHQEYRTFVTNIYGQLSEMFMFKRILFCGRVIQCKLYTRTRKQSNYTIVYTNGNGLHFGNVILYVKFRRKCPNIVYCNEYCICHGFLYLAIVQRLHICSDLVLSEMQSINELTKCFVVPVTDGETVAVPVSNIKMQCVLMEVGLENAFVGTFPNTHEKD